MGHPSAKFSPLAQTSSYATAQMPFCCPILMLRDYRFQFNIKMLSEGVMITNLYQNLWKLSNY